MALAQPGRMLGVEPAHVRHKPEETLLYQLVEQVMGKVLGVVNRTISGYLRGPT